MVEFRVLSLEGLAILEAVVEGAGSPLLSDSVFRALEITGVVQRHGKGWRLTDDGLRSLNEARERLRTGAQIDQGTG